ncbi:OmpH family outer membrane protein [Caulobacter sp. SLTY]|uniref:OmpH family outer membrane protein n=1 Tax=Caulobacter sp. SLTY TaxID=2683262 RepID=UPI001412EB39|nr:OmpH family outer membrane protein [Caulobacter sp. SLTY]NBB17233.1 OmpH family outer membrane protein [Caulobacter sp. SLTY]
MTTKSFAVTALSAAAILAIGGVALAQPAPAAKAPAAKAPAAPAALPVTHGPPLANVCVYYNARAIANSAVGKFVDTRLEQIVKTVNSELSAEETAITNEYKAIETAARAPNADANALKKRQIDLEDRFNKFRQKAELRQREVQATEAKARQRIGQELDSVIKAAYQQKGCSIVFARESFLIANPAMDITDAVTAGLNGKIQQFTFDRERLDQPAPAAAPARP